MSDIRKFRDARYHAKNSEVINRKKSAYMAEKLKDDEWVADRKLRRLIRHNDHPEKTLLATAKKGARDNDKEFSITTEDIIFTEFCPVFPEIKLEWVMDTFADCKPSLDRIDSSKGYIPGNVQVISWKANNIKKNFNADDLIAVGQFMKDNKQ